MSVVKRKCVVSIDCLLTNRNVRPSAFVHFVLQTSKFSDQVEFYKKFFNAWEVFRNDMIAFITYDEEHHRLAIGYVPDLRDRDQGVAGVDHFGFGFGRSEERRVGKEGVRTVYIRWS